MTFSTTIKELIVELLNNYLEFNFSENGRKQ